MSDTAILGLLFLAVIAVAVGGACVNTFFRRKRDK